MADDTPGQYTERTATLDYCAPYRYSYFYSTDAHTEKIKNHISVRKIKRYQPTLLTDSLVLLLLLLTEKNEKLIIT